MKSKLSPDHELLLKAVLQKRLAGLTVNQDELLRRVKTSALTPEDVDLLSDALLEEFTETGLRPDSEPNARGLKLEELIDIVRQRIPKSPGK